MKLDTYSESCCEMCGETIHNHFVECPVCHTKNADTDCYGAFYEMLDEGDTLGCEVCGSEWKLVKKHSWDADEYEWEPVIETHNRACTYCHGEGKIYSRNYGPMLIPTYQEKTTEVDASGRVISEEVRYNYQQMNFIGGWVDKKSFTICPKCGGKE